MKIPVIEQKMLNKLFSSNVVPHIQLLRDEEFPKKYTEEEKADISEITGKNFTVLGLDIYQYSLYQFLERLGSVLQKTSTPCYGWTLIGCFKPGASLPVSTATIEH